MISLIISEVIKSLSDQLGSDITLKTFLGEIYFSTPKTGVKFKEAHNEILSHLCQLLRLTMNIKIQVAGAGFITEHQNLNLKGRATESHKFSPNSKRAVAAGVRGRSPACIFWRSSQATCKPQIISSQRK